MKKDNIFYIMPRNASACKPEPDVATVSYEDLYELWLLPRLLSAPPIKSYPKPLVDFSELVLDSPAGDIDWTRERSCHNVRPVLGHSLQLASEKAERREFSAVAMEFVGYRYELDFQTVEVIEAAAMCDELINFLDLYPRYFRVTRKGGKYILKSTKALYRESGLKVWLEYSSIYADPIWIRDPDE